MKKATICLLVGIAFSVFTTEVNAMGKREDKKAVVLASFGTTYLTALKNITNIRDRVKKEFPDAEVRVAFTSNIIRKIWHKRRLDKDFMKQHGKEYDNFLNVKGILATIADLQDEGYTNIVVQSTHVFAGEEFTDLASYINGLNTIKTIKPKFMPFKSLVLGRPALGKPGVLHDYHEDLKIGAEAVAADIALAKKNSAVLVYMGHGNEFFSTGIYAEFQKVMREMYPEVKTYVGTVEGYPSLEDVKDALKKDGVKKVLLKPFMLVAGDHANNDMAGDEDDSWKNQIKQLGIEVVPVIKGLGQNPKWVEIYIQHIKDAIKDNNLDFQAEG